MLNQGMFHWNLHHSLMFHWNDLLPERWYCRDLALQIHLESSLNCLISPLV